MIGFDELRLSDELTRDDLPRVVRPFWAVSQLRDAWFDRFARQQLIGAYERLGGLGFGRYDQRAVLDTLEGALESGQLLMLAAEPVTFDPVASGKGDSITLHNEDVHEPFGFTRTLESVLKQRSVVARRQTAQPDPSESNRPLTFEESVAANKKFFGQPVSALTPQAKSASASSWFDIQLNDADGEPMGAAMYLIEQDGQVVKRGCLDHQGFARIQGVDANRCTVSFPEFDRSAWQQEAAG